MMEKYNVSVTYSIDVSAVEIEAKDEVDAQIKGVNMITDVVDSYVKEEFFKGMKHYVSKIYVSKIKSA